MKKLHSLVSTVALVACAALLFALAGCASKPAPEQAPVSGPGIQEDSDWPEFVKVPPVNSDMIFGVGAAKLSQKSASLNMAQNRARVAIAQKISTTVRNMIDDYSAEVEGDSSAAENFSRSVSRSLTEATLTGTEVIRQEQTKDGTVWVLMGVSKGDVNKLAADTVNAEKLKYAEFQNWNAQRDMEAAFAKDSGKPEIVRE